MTSPQTERLEKARQCVFHIGLPKTATKTLQMGLFARHSEVDFLGTYTRPMRKYRQCRDTEIEKLMATLLWDDLNDPDLRESRELFEKAVEPSLRNGRVPVWSWESLIEDSPHIRKIRAENIRAIFGNCRILITIRHPFNLVESLYLQNLKRENIARSRVGKKVDCPSIDTWISERWEKEGYAPNSQIQYADSIRIYSEIFGRENIGIFLFEQLQNDSDAYYRSICGFIGIDHDEALQHVLGKAHNQRWTTAQMERLQRERNSWLHGVRFRYSDRKKRRAILGMAADGSIPDDDSSAPAEAPLSAFWQEQIHEKTYQGNRFLVENWGLDLEAFDYPL